MQQRERRAQRVELFDCTDDFVLEGHAGRQDQRLAQAGSLGDQVGVAQIGRSNFQGRHIERRQGIDARLIPRGAQVGNALLRTIGAHLAVLVEAQLDLVQQILDVLHTQVFGARTIGLAPVQGLAVAQLKLDAVGARRDRGIHQLPGQCHRAVMVVADFGDDVYALATQGDAVENNRGHRIFVRQEVTPQDSKRKPCVWQPSARTACTTRWRCWGCT
ncbi:hypothetical protein D3C71_1425910 [compost metagenome]